MTLLEDIQSAAVDANIDLATLLRKCKLLAARLGSLPLESWILWESNGYPSDVVVPDYRIWPLQLKGHFSGPFGSGLRNAPIPLAFLQKKDYEYFQRYQCRQSIASIENTLTKVEKGFVQVSAENLALTLGMNVYEGQNCLQAWGEFSIVHFVEVVNTVRNRILDFALALWKEEPTAGELTAMPKSMIEERVVNQIFNTTVTGGSANIIGSASGSTVTFNVAANDLSSLMNVLRENQVQESELAELYAALEAEPTVDTKERFGPRVAAWISRMRGKAADGTWAIGLGAAGDLLAQVIAKYYGL